MGFTGDGAVAHRAGFEALHDGLNAFHFLNRHRCLSDEVQQTTQGVLLLQLLIDELAVNFEGIKAASAHGFLQRVNGERIE